MRQFVVLPDHDRRQPGNADIIGSHLASTFLDLGGGAAEVVNPRN